MKKNIFIYILALFIAFSLQAHAQIDFLGMDENGEIIETPEEDDGAVFANKTENSANDIAELENEFFGEYIEEEKKDALGSEAKKSARRLLRQEPEIIKLRPIQIKQIEKGASRIQEFEEKRVQAKEAQMKPEEKISRMVSKMDPAPLGLYWNATLEEIHKIGFNTTSVQREDYKNAYIINNPKQKNNSFASVTAIFGEFDHLWCIYAEGTPIDDTPDAARGLALYRKYYKALSQKYGNDREFFTPYTYEEEIIEENPKDKKKPIITKVTHTNPLGGENFLQELKEGKAILYSTFEKNDIGITLGISVNADKKSFISIDYKNLKIMRKDDKKEIDNIIEDI